MKRSIVGRLAAVAAVLCLITMSLTAGTLAKYASSTAGEATATVAKWAIAFKDGAGTEYTESNKITLSLEDTQKVTDKLVADDRIAPGTTGSFAMAVDGTGTEVAFQYTIEMDMSSDALKKAPIKFYSDENCTTLLTVTDNKATVTGTVMADGTSTAATSTVYWKWDSTDASTAATEDGRDTELGTTAATSGLTYTIPVTITAEQLLTAPSAP